MVFLQFFTCIAGVYERRNVETRSRERWCKKKKRRYAAAFFFLICFLFSFLLRFNGKRMSTVFFFLYFTKTKCLTQKQQPLLRQTMQAYTTVTFLSSSTFIHASSPLFWVEKKKKETKTTITTTTTKKKAHQMLEMVALQNTTDFLQASFWRSDTSSEWCFFFPPLFGYRRIRSFLLKKINCAGHFHCS